jgi:hypothetical protein
MTTSATLKNLAAWLAPHRKAETETTGEFLKRRLTSHAGSLVQEPYVTPQAIIAICKITGDDPIALIFDEVDCALTWNEPFRSYFFDDARTWLVGTDLDELVAQIVRHREGAADAKLLVDAALDGRLRILGDGTHDQVAAVRQPRLPDVQGCPS